jgi:transcription initiation factor TFIID subunit 13
LVTDFITELCFETHRGAASAGRQKIKLDDVKFACRKSPQYLGKIDEVFGKKDTIEKIRKMADVTNDQLLKSAKGIVEELGDADDDANDVVMKDVDGKSSSGKSAKGKGKNRAKH